MGLFTSSSGKSDASTATARKTPRPSSSASVVGQSATTAQSTARRMPFPSSTATASSHVIQPLTSTARLTRPRGVSFVAPSERVTATASTPTTGSTRSNVVRRPTDRVADYASMLRAERKPVSGGNTGLSTGLQKTTAPIFSAGDMGTAKSRLDLASFRRHAVPPPVTDREESTCGETGILLSTLRTAGSVLSSLWTVTGNPAWGVRTVAYYARKALLGETSVPFESQGSADTYVPGTISTGIMKQRVSPSGSASTNGKAKKKANKTVKTRKWKQTQTDTYVYDQEEDPNESKSNPKPPPLVDLEKLKKMKDFAEPTLTMTDKDGKERLMVLSSKLVNAEMGRIKARIS